MRPRTRSHWAICTRHICAFRRRATRYRTCFLLVVHGARVGATAVRDSDRRRLLRGIAVRSERERESGVFLVGVLHLVFLPLLILIDSLHVHFLGAERLEADSAVGFKRGRCEESTPSRAGVTGVSLGLELTSNFWEYMEEQIDSKHDADHVFDLDLALHAELEVAHASVTHFNLYISVRLLEF